MIGQEEIIGSDDVIPDAGREGAIAGKCFVDNVPAIAARAPVGDEGIDVALHHGGQCFSCPVAVGDPIWELRHPDEVVTTDVLAVCFSDVEDDVATSVVEDTWFRFGVLELCHRSNHHPRYRWGRNTNLHVVCWRKLAEDVCIVQNGLILCVVVFARSWLVRGRTEPELPMGLRKVVEVRGRCGRGSVGASGCT